ncbi:MAG: hypothetical protein IJW24_02370 [Clostridia bacterium]|nr:hypothetical protein [Clostridia bacterium]
MGIFDNNGGVTTLVEEKKSWQKVEGNNPPTVSCFIILEHSEAFGMDKKSYNIEILGNPMFTWVARACPTIPATLEAERGANVLELIRPYLRDSEYTLVLYSDTPLITRGSIDEILEYMSNKGLNVCKLTRGIVFRTEYIKRVGEIFAPQTYYFDEEDFITAVNFKQLALVTDILKTRILEYHMKNGVCFENPDMLVIDANVSIGKNTTISGMTRLAGKTEIGENCKIQSSDLESCKVCENVKIKNSRIEKSVIESGVLVSAGSTVADGSMINKNANIGMNVSIFKSSIGENVEVGNNSYVSSARVHNFVKVGARCELLGNKQKIVRVLENAILGDGVKIKAGVMIGEGAQVQSLKTVAQNVKTGESI